jgi:hypothetical protein
MGTMLGAALLAQVPRSAPATRPDPASFDYEAQLSALARRLLASAIGISPADRQFLQDLARPDQRYPMRTMRRLSAIAARSVRVEDREGPAELVRSDILAQTERIGCVYTAHDAENAANNWFDRMQYRVERAIRLQSLTRPVVEEYRLAGLQQLATTRDAIDLATTLEHRIA